MKDTEQPQTKARNSRIGTKLLHLNQQLIRALLGLIVIAILFFLGSVLSENLRLQNENAELKTTVRNLRDSSVIKSPVKSAAEIVGQSVKEAEKKVPPVDAADHVWGSRNAKVFLVEYGDLECTYCRRFHAVLKDIRSEYKDSVAIVYRHLPLTSIHPTAEMKARASICVASKAGDDAFFTYISTVYEKSAPKGSSFTQDEMIQFAKDQGIDTGDMAACMESDATKVRLQRDVESANTAGINSTPTSYLMTRDGAQKTFVGDMPFSAVKLAIDGLL